MIEQLKKDYEWLFSKQKKVILNGRRKYITVPLKPFIQDHDNHYRVYREKDSSPLILSKEYYEGK